MRLQPPLRFCMVTTFYPPYNFGGDGVFVYRLANELARRGHHVEVVHCVDAYQTLASTATPPEGDYPHHPNVTLHRLRSKVGPVSPLITQQTGHPGFKAPRLREILAGGRFDVVHFHNISLIGPAALSYGTGIKLYTLHEHWLVCPTHVLWKFDREPCAHKQCLLCTLHAGRPPQLWRYTGFLDSMLEHVDAFIAPSRFTRDKHREMGLDVAAPIVHIPHFLPCPVGEMSGGSVRRRPYFLFVGRLEKMKGVQTLIRAFERHRGCDLLIAGDGPYEADLRHLARGLSHVHFLGRLSYEHLRTLLRDAIAVVVPSVGYEVFGMVILEAFAQQTPAIVHDLGALPELVEQSGGGLIYDEEVGLVEALEALRSTPDLRRSLGRQGYQAYLEYWTPEAHLRRYFELIERTAEAKGVALTARSGLV